MLWLSKNPRKYLTNESYKLLLSNIQPKFIPFCTKIESCYCLDLGQSERNIFDFSLCVKLYVVVCIESLCVHICINRKCTNESLLHCHTWKDLLQRVSGLWWNWDVWINWRLIGTLCWIFNFWHTVYVCRFCLEEI